MTVSVYIHIHAPTHTHRQTSTCAHVYKHIHRDWMHTCSHSYTCLHKKQNMSEKAHPKEMIIEENFAIWSMVRYLEPYLEFRVDPLMFYTSKDKPGRQRIFFQQWLMKLSLHWCSSYQSLDPNLQQKEKGRNPLSMLSLIFQCIQLNATSAMCFLKTLFNIVEVQKYTPISIKPFSKFETSLALNTILRQGEWTTETKANIT